MMDYYYRGLEGCDERIRNRIWLMIDEKDHPPTSRPSCVCFFFNTLFPPFYALLASEPAFFSISLLNLPNGPLLPLCGRRAAYPLAPFPITGGAAARCLCRAAGEGLAVRDLDMGRVRVARDCVGCVSE
jgi:hypothetical protein